MSRNRKLFTSTPMLLALLILSSPGCQPAARPDERSVRSTEAGWKGEVTDDRTAITVDAATRQAVLTEMRTMLAAVQGVVGGAAAWDTAAMRTAARSGGVAAASEANPEVEAQLGHDFVQLGMRTHVTFDSLAEDIGYGSNREVVLKRLATVMGNCVGCHNQWRLVVQP